MSETTQTTDCLFCNIVNKNIPAEIVFENDRILAFRDIFPQAPVHILVIPKVHRSTFKDITDDDCKLGLPSDIFSAINQIAQAEKLEDFRLVVNVGPKAGQTVFHLHFHILGGKSQSWPPGEINQ